MRVVIVGASGNVGTALLRRFADDPTVTSVVALARRRTPAAVVAAHDLPAPYDAARWLACDVAATDPDDEVVERLARAFSGADAVRSSTFSLDKVAVERIVDDVERRHPAVAVARVRSAWVAQRAAGHQIASASLGPLGPSGRLARGRGLPWPRGLRVQAVHADDLAAAHREIVVRQQAGAFNVAAPDRATRDDIAALVGDDQLREVAPSLVRGALMAARFVRIGPADPRRLDPADPRWLDVIGAVPAVDTTRAHRLLGWSPRNTSAEALGELIAGMLDGAGTASPPLRPARGTAPG